jgi:predicted ribosome quality control (RQC) complex YloA/Tae2 family protein
VTFDALAFHALHDELQRRTEGARVDEVRLVDERRVALELYGEARLTLVFAMSPTDPRIYLTSSRVRRGTDTVTPFLLLLRKYVRGSRIGAIAQPRLERVLILRLATHPRNGGRDVLLIAEAIGRRTNLILVDEDDSIMDALVRLPTSVNARRPVLPHLRYTPPSREPKLDPLDSAMVPALERAAPSADGTAASLLIRVVDGLSPLAAGEVVARSGLDAEIAARDVTRWKDVANALRGLAAPIENGEWEPSVAWEGERVRGFAPYHLRQFADATVRRYASMSEVNELTATAPTASAPRTILKQPLLEAIEARLEQLRRKRGSLERSLASADRAEELREAGEAILANATTIAPETVALEWNGRRIDLYPNLSPSQNAQAYFREYAAARDARKTVPPLLEEAAAEIDHMAEMAVHVTLAERDDEITVLRGELASLGVQINHRRPGTRARQPKPQKGPGTGAYRRDHVNGAEVLVGRSALGNETVTFRLAGADDLWFHTRGIPGAHVILRTNGKPQPAERIEAVARLAAACSAARDETRVPVDYTLKRYVKRIPGGSPGRVTYRGESTIAVSPGIDLATP